MNIDMLPEIKWAHPNAIGDAWSKNEIRQTPSQGFTTHEGTLIIAHPSMPEEGIHDEPTTECKEALARQMMRLMVLNRMRQEGVLI